jgi:flagellar motor switch protein FliM
VSHTLDHFFNNRLSNSNEDDKESTEALRKLAANMKINVAGVLDETNFTINDISNLKVGDVLRLDSKVTNNLKVFVEGKNKFNGKLGLYGSKKAIQIIGLSNV